MNGTERGQAPGSVSLLGGQLLAFGLWMIVQAFFLPHEAETVRLSVITGAFCALLGGWLLAARMRARSARPRHPDSGQAPQPDGGGTPTGIPRAIDRIGPEIGCFVISLGFLLVGPIFLWLYFSGAETRRGNPAMGLVAGILFTALGFLGILALGSMRRKSRRKWGRNDPRRLP